MNTPVTSRDEILHAAKELVLTQGTEALNMRSLAQYRGIAVGSIYNYFPAKSDLMIAVVAELWQDIFHPSLFQQQEASFLALVDRLSGSIRSSIASYPGFFGAHALIIDNKVQGRNAMEQYFHHIEQALCRALLSDPDIRPNIWSPAFSPEDFSVFVFHFLRTDLLHGQDRSAFLRELLLHVLY